MEGTLGTIFTQPDTGRTDKNGNKEFIVHSKAGSKGSVYYTRRHNPSFREPAPIAPTAKIEGYQRLVMELRLARLKTRLTQSQLAKTIGSNQAALSRFELGKTNPTIAFIHAYAQALGCVIIFDLEKTPS